MRPLTLAHLCAIFERYNKIPEKPKSVYSKVISLLLEEWDSQRAVERVSKYSHFEVDRKVEFLSRLAFELTTRYKTFVFSKSDLAKSYKIIHTEFKLPESEMLLVINEIESHNGLFVQSGADSYEFAHKSLQEFLTASYIRGLDEIPTGNPLLLLLPNELAIATSLSSDQTSFFSKLILKRFKPGALNMNFMTPFLARLIAEKPDFRVSEGFAVAVLAIYSSFAAQGMDNPNYTVDTQQEVNSENGQDTFQKQNLDIQRNDLEALIKQFLDMPEFKQSLGLIKSFFYVSGDKIMINRKAHYFIKPGSHLKTTNRDMLARKMIIKSDYVKLFEKEKIEFFNKKG